MVFVMIVMMVSIMVMMFMMVISMMMMLIIPFMKQAPTQTLNKPSLTLSITLTLSSIPTIIRTFTTTALIYAVDNKEVND